MFASDIKHDNTALADKLHQLYNLKRNKKIDLGFRPPYISLLEKMGNPHKKLPPTIHVAGTNGKGSTIAMLRAVLQEAGYSVHAYTSPHLVKFNERIMLNNQDISDEVLEPLIDEALALNNGDEITFFEITTAIAFKAFSETPADIVLLETGLGGRLDCTNVIEDPLLTIITRIAHDHVGLLGETLPEIAAEKAGIMKQGVPCIIGAQENDAVLQVFADRNIPIQHAMSTQTPLPPLGLPGAHQRENAATVITALQTIKEQFPITEEALLDGLAKTQWRARLQNITAHFDSPEGTEIWLDGGHNPNAAGAIAAWAQESDKPLHLIVGMMPHKDEAGYLGILKPHCTSIQHVAIPGETETPLTYQDALKQLSQDSTSKNILIGGSLYLAGHVLETINA